MDWDRYNALVALRNSGRIEEATIELTKVAETEKDQYVKAIVLLEIANGFRLLKRFSDARLKLHEASTILGAEHEFYPRALLAMAVVDIEEEDWRAALKKLDSILEKNISLLQIDDNKDVFEEVQRNRGIALFELKRIREALPLLESVRSVEYQRERTLYSLAMSHLELADFDAAKLAFEELLSLHPNSIYRSHAHYHLGRILYSSGQNARAKTEFEKCLACPDKGKISDQRILEGLVYSCQGLNLAEDAARYAEMLKNIG